MEDVQERIPYFIEDVYTEMAMCNAPRASFVSKRFDKVYPMAFLKKSSRITGESTQSINGLPQVFRSEITCPTVTGLSGGSFLVIKKSNLVSFKRANGLISFLPLRRLVLIPIIM